MVHRLDDGRFVHRHVHRLAYFKLVEGFVPDVVSDVAKVETGLFDNLQLRVVLQCVKVSRAWMQGDLALVLAQLLDTHRRIDVDREDQLVEFDLSRVPVVLVAAIADLRVLLVTLEHERAGTDRFLVDVAGASGGHQLVGVLG
ncbi:hypothetical protein D3C76_1256450 [compost metagenome]